MGVNKKISSMTVSMDFVMVGLRLYNWCHICYTELFKCCVVHILIIKERFTLLIEMPLYN